MVLVGVALMLAGLVVAMPSEGTSGSVARTIIRQGSRMWQTRGRAQSDAPGPWWHSAVRVLIGLALIALGLWVIVLFSDSESV